MGSANLRSRSSFVIALVSVAILATGGTAFGVVVSDAYSLGVTQMAPDVRSNMLSLSYDVTGVVGDIVTGNLVVTAKSIEMDVDGLAPPNDFLVFPTATLGPQGGDYTIDITLEVDTIAETITPTGGTLEILGYLADYRAGGMPLMVPGTGTLLTGDVRAFGFDDSGTLEFVFDSTGGDLIDPSYPVDVAPVFSAWIGAIVHPTEAAGGGAFSDFFSPLGLDAFTQDFTNCPNSGDSDTFVPEPSMLVGLATLLLAALAIVPRRRRSA